MTKHWTRWLGGVVAAATLVLSAGAAQAADGWTASPATGVNGPISSSSDTDAWALGTSGFAHWNGSNWQQVAAPAGIGRVNAFATRGPADAWAVGRVSATGYRISNPQISHWNGSTWSISTSPAISGRRAGLNSAAAVSASDAWAVGSDGRFALVEHWDGTSWSRVTVPEPATDDFFSSKLGAVSARSASDIWAVGTWGHLSSAPDSLYALHYDGTSWSVVPMEQTGSLSNSNAPVANGVVAIAANDVWMVGDQGNFGSPLTLTEHWNGSKWAIVPSPFDHGSTSSNSISSGALAAVTARGPNDVWAGGDSFTFTDGDPAGVYSALLIHWDGTRWTQAPAPTTGTNNSIQGLATTPGAHIIWATNAGSPNLLTHP
ncbi:hypothetical protein [Actinomadura decatromicini]|uniref:Uncharacterized protein n=1 Tax=Actinomadura decatromicini TaxID=2604572 RepID=A0A5D3FSR7_9ACTN|nr:hypothetical protein [Actinomadura decatromicini]TYK51401.1 hypothetical protein FXF68_13435 [Actinomadura decatromicini]